MKCFKCGNDFEEREIQSSHDIPCYLFDGSDRKERKQRADKYGRHWLCEECHDKIHGTKRFVKGGKDV